MRRLRQIARVLNEAAHAINDPMPGEKWIAAAVFLIFLWTVVFR